MDLTDIPKVNEAQVRFAENLGINVTSNTVHQAAARIEECILLAFWGVADMGHPTPKQVALGEKYGFDIKNCSRIFGDAVIDDIMLQLNKSAIRELNLAPSVRVMRVSDSLERQETISSIGEDGTVYFRGGNGGRAWARNLKLAQ